MNHALFQLLSPLGQLHYVLTWGSFLTQRWENEGGVNLYYLPSTGRGFFAEVGYDEGTQQAVVRRSFEQAGPLQAYCHSVRLLFDQ